jgi:hypothetical protein
MATVRTVDKKKFEVEVSGAKLDEEITHVAARGVPILRVKREGKDEFVWINANHIVSFDDGEEK